jgi:hypothetical protein
MIDIRLEDLMPTPFNYRRQFIRGSDARIIMGPDEEALNCLWREKRGEAEPKDFSDNLIVQLATAKPRPASQCSFGQNEKTAVLVPALLCRAVILTVVLRRCRKPHARSVAGATDEFNACGFEGRFDSEEG